MWITGVSLKIVICIAKVEFSLKILQLSLERMLKKIFLLENRLVLTIHIFVSSKNSWIGEDNMLWIFFLHYWFESKICLELDRNHFQFRSVLLCILQGVCPLENFYYCYVFEATTKISRLYFEVPEVVNTNQSTACYAWQL